MAHRALVVCASPAAGAAEHVAMLATDADLVLAVDGGLSVCRSAGVRADIVVGDLDSACSDDQEWARSSGSSFDVYAADKDDSDLDLALRVAAADATELVVTACTGGRADHLLVVFGSVALRATVPVTISEPDLTAWVLRAGLTDSICLLGRGATVSLIAIGGAATVSCTGMRWELDHARLEPLSSLGLSNRIAENAATIVVHRGSAVAVSPGVGASGPAERG